MVQAQNPWAWAHLPTPNVGNFYRAVLMFLGDDLTALWIVLLPVAAVLPAGDSVAVDRRRGMDALLISRVGWGRYLCGKLIGTISLAVAAVAAAMVIAGGLAAAVYPIALPKFLGWTVNLSLPYRVKISGVFGNYFTTFQPHLFWAAPGLYILLVGVVALWAVASLAALTTAAAAWLRPPVFTLLAPVVLYFGVTILGESVGIAQLPWVYGGAYLWVAPPVSSWIALGAYWAVPALGAVLVVGWMAWVSKQWPAGSVGR
jgi:hypothetical protein